MQAIQPILLCLAGLLAGALKDSWATVAPAQEMLAKARLELGKNNVTSGAA